MALPVGLTEEPPMILILTVLLLLLVALAVGFRIGQRGPRREPGHQPPPIERVEPEIMFMIHQGRRIDAIRKYRARYRVDLMSAREAVDALTEQESRRFGTPPPVQR